MLYTLYSHRVEYTYVKFWTDRTDKAITNNQHEKLGKRFSQFGE